MKKIIKGREVEYLDVIHHTTTTNLSFLDRVKILFGCKVVISSEIYTKEECSVVASEAKTFVTPLVRKRYAMSGMMHESIQNEPPAPNGRHLLPND